METGIVGAIALISDKVPEILPTIPCVLLVQISIYQKRQIISYYFYENCLLLDHTLNYTYELCFENCCSTKMRMNDL